MNFEEYRAQAVRTAATLNTDEKLVNAALGLIGETGEIADALKKAIFQGHAIDEAKIIDEIGDVLWYVALAVTAWRETKKDIEAIHWPERQEVRRSTVDVVFDLSYCAADTARRINSQATLTSAETMLRNVVYNLSVLADLVGTTLEHCAALNIEKLRRRYPDGFSAERSLHRED